ncbi:MULTISPECIES: sensor histidine kinase [Streptomyces]|uniref:sensor histidine kinase n=1 Tax=Streptomyces TaxID=1883 RepID=UPI00163BF39D|nr:MULTISPECIES: histidine kinase [Streptomyces]MBC2876381.1 two-component sensor histidine kinase [Streptomyces sp. TYQ1024]UBI35402.1 histidine kinase [Streptomyces mobaraensis]UKW27994.1 histidine kinase [Streptomyces sp. TYQ1024]
MHPLHRLFRPLTRAVTCTRWLHLVVGGLFAMVCMFVYPGGDGGRSALLLGSLATVPPLVVLGLVPAVRVAEGVQARLMLVPGPRLPGRDRSEAAAIATAPAACWADRWRTVGWLVLRVQLGTVTLAASVWLPTAAVDLAVHRERAYALLAPVPLVALAALVVGAGKLTAAAARWLLAPSAAERIAALEERAERLLEHNRLARELHDSIGHALTTAVVQAGAARAAGSPEFTERALAAIEETGRHALEDLERVLKVLREGAQDPAGRPTLADARRLLDAADGSGAEVTAELTGPLEAVPGPVSREGYRIVQEALTNVLRHAGPVPVTVRIAVTGDAVELDVRNPLPGPRPAAAPRRGSGLRGIRERAALLGGRAETGPYEDGWRVSARLPTA